MPDRRTVAMNDAALSGDAVAAHSSSTLARVASAPLHALRRSTRPWRTAALFSLTSWCIVLAFISRACIPRALDLRVYRAAATVALHGGAPYALTFTAQHFPFTYPPFALLVFSPLTLPRVHAAIWTFDLCNALALVTMLLVCVRVVLRRSWPTAIVLATLLGGLSCLLLEPVRSTLLDGQVNLLLLCAVVVDLFAVPAARRGVLVGLAGAMKLTPLVFVLYLLVARERAAAVRACVTFLAVTAVSWLVLPSDSATFWVHQAFSPGRKGGTRTSYNQSWYGLLGRLSTSADVRTATWGLLALATLLVGCFVARRLLARGRPLDAVLAMAVTGLLACPVSWTHHWSWVALAPVALLAREGRSRAVDLAMGLLLAVAVLAPYGWHVTGPGSVVLGFSLVFSGALLLCVMAVVVWRDGPARVPALPTRTVAAST